MYFRYEGEGNSERCHFHQSIGVDESRCLKITGTFDPSRFEASSPKSNLSGQRKVHITGIAASVDPDPVVVEIRPILIRFPYFVSAALADAASMWARQELELHYSRLDQFGINSDGASASVSVAETNRLFAVPEDRVKRAFAQILNVTNVPNDWPGELSDLVVDLTVEGNPIRAAFAFKGPGGKSRPWTLYPAGMGKNGDQAVRLFSEHADVMVAQHCGSIATSVRHMMEALAIRHSKRYMIMDGDATTRVLIQAGLLEEPEDSNRPASRELLASSAPRPMSRGVGASRCRVPTVEPRHAGLGGGAVGVLSRPRRGVRSGDRLREGPQAVAAGQAVCHGHVAPRNAVFAGGRTTAFIDWDVIFLSTPMRGPRARRVTVRPCLRRCRSVAHRTRPTAQRVSQRWRAAIG